MALVRFGEVGWDSIAWERQTVDSLGLCCAPAWGGGGKMGNKPETGSAETTVRLPEAEELDARAKADAIELALACAGLSEPWADEPLEEIEGSPKALEPAAASLALEILLGRDAELRDVVGVAVEIGRLSAAANLLRAVGEPGAAERAELPAKAAWDLLDEQFSKPGTTPYDQQKLKNAVLERLTRIARLLRLSDVSGSATARPD
jgi:hypothetical protein